jgi:hypothetical protein
MLEYANDEIDDHPPRASIIDRLSDEERMQVTRAYLKGFTVGDFLAFMEVDDDDPTEEICLTEFQDAHKARRSKCTTH